MMKDARYHHAGGRGACRFFLAFSFGLSFIPVQAEMSNLIRNGDFEVADEAGKVPADWAFSWKSTHSNDARMGRQKQEPDHGIDTRVFHEGAQSFRIGVRRAEDDGVLSQENVAARKGTKIYRVSAWIRTKGLRGTSARVALVFLADKGKWLGANYSAITVTENHDWKRYTALVEAHPKTARMRVRLWLNFSYSGSGTAWFDNVQLEATDLTETPPIRYVDDRPMPELASFWKEAGYVLFRRNYLEMTFPNSRPREEEIGKPVELMAARGETEPVSFCIRALKGLRGVDVRFSDFAGTAGNRIPASAITPGLVRCLYRRGQARWGPFADGRMQVPVYVEPGRAFDLSADETKQVWATVQVPPNAAPGKYRGSAIVRASNAPERSLSVEFEVTPFALPEPRGTFMGMYSSNRKPPEVLDKIYADMRDHGMTTIGLCGPLGSAIRKDGDRVEILFDGKGTLEMAMAAYVKAGFPEPVVWLMGSDVGRWSLKQGPLESNAFEDAYRQVILRIIEKGKQAHWPEILFQPVDEPFEHTKSLPMAKRCLQILKTIPGLRTEEDGPNGGSLRLEELYPWSDILVLHDGPVLRRGQYDARAWQDFLKRIRKDGKQVWFYNIDLTGYHPEVMRWGYGFGLWFSHATGMIEWAYQFGLTPGKEARPYQRENSIIYVYPRWKDEPGGPTIGWEAIREGVDDYKYLYALDQALKKMKRSGNARSRKLAEEARAYLLSLEKKTDFRAHEGSAAQGDWTGPKEIAPTGERLVHGSYKMANGWAFEDYDAARRKIADYLKRLEALK